MSNPNDDIILQSASAGAFPENEKKLMSLPLLVSSMESKKPPESVHYRLYKQRFVGLVALVLLNIVTGMSWPWFGPIANNAAADFHITLNEVNWLGNVISCVYLPTALLVPILVSKYGITRNCYIGAVSLILSSWIRYAGTAPSLSGNRAYSLLIIGQIFAGIAQPIYQVIGPKYSENWFDLKGRTTATMLISIGNPVGAALGQLISPFAGTTKQSILVLGIISTAVTPFVFLVVGAPPSPPTYAGSKPPQSLLSLLRAMVGMVDPSSGAYMSLRSRIDFAIITIIFGIFVAAANTFSILTAEIFVLRTSVAYWEHCLLLTGLVAAIITAPLFDRLLVPPLAAAWLSLIWAVKPHNVGALFAVMTIIGVISLTLLAVGLELGADLTRNADASSAILWFMGNLIGIISVLVQQALRASSNATPPLNMRRALIFNGVIAMVAVAFILPLQGKQDRKRLDEAKMRELESSSDSQKKVENGQVP
ncbi:major facilitator superfamily domain-containing protein [Amanita rubescens]|nr:major facilitator superfamily domain-containing protein [Amanita rubescens]